MPENMGNKVLFDVVDHQDMDVLVGNGAVFGWMHGFSKVMSQALVNAF